jgi:fused signal recognition particle receptor
MFEGLKKKFSDFVGSIVKKEEAEERVEEKAEQQPEQSKGTELKPEPQSIIKDKPRLSTATRIKGAIFRSVTIRDKDVDDLLEKFKLSLLEADVNYEVAEKLIGSIRTKLVGASVESKDISNYINRAVSDSLYEILNKGSGVVITEAVQAKRQSNELPFRILFLGPNGSGKTTTMAKVANMLIKNGISCVFSASDTFRAAAIEQTVHHANKLGINVIKSGYGADPASVAFDAIAYAKAHGIDVVLIDSAGRQETNKSLIEEIKKMVRIAKPDLKIFIGEGIAGNALLDQVKQFDAAVKVDGIILTKLDCDTKGGNTISILSETQIPILFFGVGEAYDDLIEYQPEFIIRNIVGNN